MDTRESENQIPVNNEVAVLLEQDQQVLRIDRLKQNRAYKDSMIINLVNKMDIKAVMESVYIKELEYIDSFPKELKYYVHFPYLLHSALATMFLLRYKKKLNGVTGLAVLCAATVANEFGRYKRVQASNATNWPKYVEARDNYEQLLGGAVSNNNIGFKDVMKFFFRVDIDASYKRIKHLFNDDLLNDDVITSHIF